MSTRTIDLRIPLPSTNAHLLGILTLPPNPIGLIVFAHGSGSSHRSPRNQYVARQLHTARLATALVDLLSADEEREDSVTAHLRFDIPLLTHRLSHIITHLRASCPDDCRALPVGTFGASTGGAAAIEAAALRPDDVTAVVSRGGRPDLANHRLLSQLTAPTLLLVGSRDREVIDMNRRAMARMVGCGVKELVLVEGATHLFEERGALEVVAERSKRWFERWLGEAAEEAEAAAEPAAEAGKGQEAVVGEVVGSGEGRKEVEVRGGEEAEGKRLEIEQKEA